MATDVRYEPEGRELDLASLAPRDYQLITGLYGTIERGDRVLTCLVSGGDLEMYVKRSRNGNFFAAHFPGEGHGDHPIAPETVEHRRQKDYWVRAARACGLDAATEVRVPGGVLDVAITGGPVTTDVEVQRVTVKLAVITRRTRTYHKAGFLPVWFNDGGSRPLWLRTVPALGCTRWSWDRAMPRARSIGATGLGALRVVRCDVGEFGGRCPKTHRAPCGRMHPRVDAGKGHLTVDDVAGMIPAGEIVPLRYWNGNVFLVSLVDFYRFRDMTGGLGTWAPVAGVAPGRSSASLHPEPCHNPTHNAPIPSAQLYPLTTNAAPSGHVRQPADVPLRGSRATSVAKDMCPVCGTARLLHGRSVCQGCGLLAAMGRL
jgi:hypothetical protein